MRINWRPGNHNVGFTYSHQPACFHFSSGFSYVRLMHSRTASTCKSLVRVPRLSLLSSRQSSSFYGSFVSPAPTSSLLVTLSSGVKYQGPEYSSGKAKDCVSQTRRRLEWSNRPKQSTVSVKSHTRGCLSCTLSRCQWH